MCSTLKWSYIVIRCVLVQGGKDDSISTNHSLWHTAVTSCSIKNHMISSQMHKIFWQNSTLIWDKNTQESRYRGNIPQGSKGRIKHSHSYRHTQCRKAESISSKLNKKTRMPILITSIKNSIGSLRIIRKTMIKQKPRSSHHGSVVNKPN